MATLKTSWTTNTYPSSRRSDHVDVYKSEKQGEVRVPDPYNWLEDSNSPETEAWVEEQEAFTRQYLDQNPKREALEQSIRVNTDFEKFSRPVLKKDGRWYWIYNSGLQAQYVYYRSKDDKLPHISDQSGPEQNGEVFFDQNLLTDDGTGVIQVSGFSEDGKYFAYGVSLSGSDFSTIYVRNTSSPFSDKKQRDLASDPGRLEEILRFVKFSSITWTKDSKGFFYQRAPDRDSHGEVGEDKAGTEVDKDLDFMLMYHRVGTPQSKDILVMKDASNREYMWSAQTTLDGRYVILYTSKDTSRKNLLWIADLTENEINQNMKWVKVINEFESSFYVIENDGTKFYIRTNENAPQYKVITIDLADSSLAHTDLIPEVKDAKLDTVELSNETFVIVYKKNVKDELYLYSKNGEKIKRLAADFVGKMDVAARRDQSWFFVTLSGFTTPGTIARYNFTEANEEKKWSIYRTTKLNGLNPDDFSAEQVWYDGKDGTKVPMFIVRHKSTPTDGTAPALQYGYGGFSVSIDPFFGVSFLTFLQHYHAVLAVPNIRGGGEFGEDWHQGGVKERKMNVFNDFIAATEYLKKNKIAGKVAINGGSNGGLLVAACANIAPQGTFDGAIAQVGVLDMLKFNKFTIGRAWVSDYGNPDDPHDFDFIYPYSPVHNVPKDKVLPPIILTTADHDDRVVPLHSFKHVATLQHTLPDNPNPLLIRIDKKAGHGAGKSTEQKIKELADVLGFVAQSIGLQWYET